VARHRAKIREKQVAEEERRAEAASALTRITLDRALKRAAQLRSAGFVPHAVDLSESKSWETQRKGTTWTDVAAWKGPMTTLAAVSRYVQQENRNEREIPPPEQELLKIALDYVPMVIRPRRATPADTQPAEPWRLSPREMRGYEHVQREDRAAQWLSVEIARFVDYMKPTDLELSARLSATREVVDFLRACWKSPRSTGLEMHGSQNTGLVMATSDIDIRIWSLSPGAQQMDAFQYSQNVLQRMSPAFYALRRRPDRFGLVTLREGIHPIINFTHRPSGLDFQVVATKSSLPQEIATRRYLAETPNLYELYVVVRSFFEVRGLLPVHSGGIGSYGCFAMLLPSLLRTRLASGRAEQPITLAEVLRGFLDFYDPTTTINPTKYGVSCSPRQRFKRHDPDPQFASFVQSAQRRGDQARAGQWQLCQRNPYQPYLLSIQDPANPFNDLGSRTHAIKHILASLVRARQVLEDWTRKTAAADQFTKRDSSSSIVSKIVGRPDLLYGEQRKVLEAYGRAALRNPEPVLDIPGPALPVRRVLAKHGEAALSDPEPEPAPVPLGNLLDGGSG
jgi:non-canonical poly(A) RNA polymerase PAPD5/7